MSGYNVMYKTHTPFFLYFMAILKVVKSTFYRVGFRRCVVHCNVGFVGVVSLLCAI